MPNHFAPRARQIQPSNHSHFNERPCSNQQEGVLVVPLLTSAGINKAGPVAHCDINPQALKRLPQGRSVLVVMSSHPGSGAFLILSDKPAQKRGDVTLSRQNCLFPAALDKVRGTPADILKAAGRLSPPHHYLKRLNKCVEVLSRTIKVLERPASGF